MFLPRNATFFTRTPSFSKTASVGLPSSSNPQRSSVPRTAGKLCQTLPPSPPSSTCSRVSSVLRKSAIASAWAKAFSLASEKSVGCSTE